MGGEGAEPHDFRGAKLSAREYKPTPRELEDIDQLKRVYARREGNLKFQDLLDWFHEGR